jgi:hypothetical protein
MSNICYFVKTRLYSYCTAILALTVYVDNNLYDNSLCLAGKLSQWKPINSV